MKNKLLGILLSAMVLMLAACGGGNSAAVSSKEYVYRAEEVVIPGIEDKNTMNDFYIKNDRMYISCYQWGETGSSIIIYNANMDGSDLKSMSLQVKQDSSYSYLTADGLGSYYGVYDEYFSDDSDPNNYIWEDNYYLIKLDQQGNEVWKQPLNKESDNYWVQWMKVLKDGRIALKDTNGLFIYDGEGNITKEIAPETEDDSSEVYLMTDGTLVTGTYKSEAGKNVLNKLDVETGKLSEDYILPSGFGSFTLYPGNGYDFLVVGNSSLYGYNLGDEEAAELMNYVDSDLSTNYIYNVAAVSNTEFYGMINDDLTGETLLMKFTKVNPKDVVDKTVLTLGCNGMDWEVRTQVIHFNKTNERYRIRIEDYSQYNTDEDYTGGITKLNTDIASGKVPDILVLDRQLPVESYISKGLFEDLYPYMDKDEEIKREDFLSNILAAYETDGKLYRLVPRFSISTVAGKTADVGSAEGWTLEELNGVMAAKPEGTQVFSEMTRSSILNYSIEVAGEQFIDWESGACNFNSQGFIDLLEFAAQFPEQLDDEYYNDSFWRNYSALWREDEVLLSMLYLDSFASYNYAKKGTFGEDITLIGFPSEDRRGSSIASGLELVMSSKSKHKDGAWEFLRYFLSDEYQNKIEYGWPLNMKCIDALAEKAKQKPTYEDENGNLVEYDQTYMVGEVEIPITPMSQEDIDVVVNFIKSVDQLFNYNQNLETIIAEEAAPYFEGQKSAKEVADIIQSRVQIYVNENL